MPRHEVTRRAVLNRQASLRRNAPAPVAEPPAPSHYFASTYAAWAVAPTRVEAIRGAVRNTGKTLVDHARKDGGLEVLSCFVPLPKAAAYEIVNYLPERKTGARDVEKHRVVGMRGTPVQIEPR